MNKCKRYTVVAWGFDHTGIVRASNGNEEECSGEVGNCGCIHAEINLLKEMPNPQKVRLSHSPCIDCAVALVNSGVKVVEYTKEYRILRGVNYLRENGVLVRQI